MHVSLIIFKTNYYTYCQTNSNLGGDKSLKVGLSSLGLLRTSGHRLQRGRSYRPIPVFACSSKTFVSFAKRRGTPFRFRKRREKRVKKERTCVIFVRRESIVATFFPMPYIVSKPLTDITTRWRARVQIKPRQLAYVRSVDGLSDGKEARWDVTPAVSWTPRCGRMHQMSVSRI